MDIPVIGETAIASGSLEIIELELALKHQDFLELGFEGTLRKALDVIGGTLLFQMRMDGASGCDWVAAVSLDGGDERRFAVVSQPAEGGPLTVEDAETSELPIAQIAAAYAGLMDRLEAAA